MFSPCKGCKERTAKCHADCEKYFAFREYCEQKRKERDRDSNVRDYFGERKIKTARIFKRRIYGTHKNDS